MRDSKVYKLKYRTTVLELIIILIVALAVGTLLFSVVISLISGQTVKEVMLTGFTGFMTTILVVYTYIGVKGAAREITDYKCGITETQKFVMDLIEKNKKEDKGE